MSLPMRSSILRRAPQVSRSAPIPHRGPIPRRNCPTSRHASTTTTTQASYTATRRKNFVLGTALTLALGFGYLYITDTRAGVHRWIMVPTLRLIYPDAEDAHEAGTKALKSLYAFNLHPRERNDIDSQKRDLEIEVFGHTLRNPIGTSAGIDKHAEIPDPLLALGPAIIEIGGTTPNPQDGNVKPRVWRLPSQNALINRYGLNSEGADHVAMRLRERVREYAYRMGFGIDEVAEQRVLDGEAGVPPGSLTEGKLMAVQIAKNKYTPDDDIEAVKRDYVYCVEALARYADIIVVNVSSPNTPGLRGLQKVEPLTKIMTAVVDAASRSAGRKTRPAVMVKVSPDEDSDEQLLGVAHAVWESGVDGVIVGNTTKGRPEFAPTDRPLSSTEMRLLKEQGGYSGPTLFKKTVDLVGRYRKLLDQGMYERGSKSGDMSDEPATPPDEPTKSESNEKKGEGAVEKIEATIDRDMKNLKPQSGSEMEKSESQPLIRLPARNNPLSDDEFISDTKTSLSNSHHLDQLPAKGATMESNSKSPPSPKSTPSSKSTGSPQPCSEQKVIFATGGITNGAQALEVLNAGASVAMVYTALVYGGVGTITKIKDEMRTEMKKKTKP
ncbi:Dihydroorotate dehydrogenase (quinone), mitochondrial [Agyrium rufum]|nr:Dihydroorotate dehydrogenase (quinone), mitochondrial [Agyrium rufum]